MTRDTDPAIHPPTRLPGRPPLVHRRLRQARTLAFAIAFGLVGPIEASADDVPTAVYPALPRTGVTAARFAPAGWIVEAQASGDLDGDGVADLALVLRGTDPRNRIRSGPAAEAATFDSHLRIFAVVLGEPGGTGYRLGLENRTLIPRRVSATQDDAFEGPDALSIRDGAILIRLQYFASAGGWDTGNRTLRVRDRGGFRLVGCEAYNLHRASGATRATSVNFLARRAQVATGSIRADGEAVRRYILPRRAPPTLAEVGDGLAFDPLPGARRAR